MPAVFEQLYCAEDALARVHGCTVLQYFEMDRNAPLNFEDCIINPLQMGMQN